MHIVKNNFKMYKYSFQWIPFGSFSMDTDQSVLPRAYRVEETLEVLKGTRFNYICLMLCESKHFINSAVDVHKAININRNRSHFEVNTLIYR